MRTALVAEARQWAPCAMSPGWQLKLVTKLADALEAAGAERDAAVAAIERVRARLQPTLGGTPTGEFADVCGCGKDYFPCDHAAAIIAALDGAPEPEWEYVGMAFEHGGFMRIRNDQLVPEKFDSWRKLVAQYPRVEILKRIKSVSAGPWMPVESEGTDG